MLVSPFSPDSFNDVIVLGNFAIFACFDLDNKILVTSIYFMFNPSLFSIVYSLLRNNNFTDRWILNRASVAIADANTAFKEYTFQQCTTAVYNFWLYDLCDVYLEATKRIFIKVTSPLRIFVCKMFRIRPSNGKLKYSFN